MLTSGQALTAGDKPLFFPGEDALVGTSVGHGAYDRKAFAQHFGLAGTVYYFGQNNLLGGGLADLLLQPGGGLSSHRQGKEIESLLGSNTRSGFQGGGFTVGDK